MPIGEITIRSTWDSEAEVWFATSEDVPGLVLEAENPRRYNRGGVPPGTGIASPDADHLLKESGGETLLMFPVQDLLPVHRSPG